MVPLLSSIFVKTFLSYALAIIGMGMLGMTLVRALASNLSYPASRLLLTNLLRQNPNQAEAACRNMKGTVFEAIGAAIKIAAMCGTQDPKVVAGATKPGYDGAVTAIGAQWKMLLGKAKLGGMAVAGGLLLAISAGAMPIWLVVIIGALGAAAGIKLLLRKAEVDRSLILGRADLLPEVDRAFIEGRYQLPPQ